MYDDVCFLMKIQVDEVVGPVAEKGLSVAAQECASR